MTMDNLKGLVIILDGLGDRPCHVLDGKTPLEHADTPVLDSIAAANQSGLMNPLLPGIPVDTHTGVSMLFGLQPADACNLRRGPIEAAGIGLNSSPGDLLFRANLSTIEEDQSHSLGHFRIIDRRAQRIQKGTEKLCHQLQNISLGNGITASLYPATHHRCVLKLSGPDLSDRISDTDPGGKNIDQGVLMAEPLGESNRQNIDTAHAINRFSQISHQILKQHPVNKSRVKNGQWPANGVITRGAGQHICYTNILSYLKLRVSVVAGEATIIGLGNLFGFETLTLPTFTSDTNTHLDDKIAAAIKALQSNDLVYVHIKGTDTASHDRDPLRKSRFIEKFDQALGKVNLDNLILGICADHSTDSIRGEHNGDSVPILIHNPYGRSDLVNRFNETDCSIGAYGRLSAQGFITSVLDAMSCLPNFKPHQTEFYKSGTMVSG